MTDKSNKVHMVNESQVRTFIRNDITYEIQSCVRACNLRTAGRHACFSDVHNNVSKFDRVTNPITKRAKRE